MPKFVGLFQPTKLGWMSKKGVFGNAGRNFHCWDKHCLFQADPTTKVVDDMFRSRARAKPLKEASFLERKPVAVIQPLDEIIEGNKPFQNPDYFQVRDMFTVKELFDARVHLGHKVGSVNHYMKPFLFGSRFETCIFDLDITAFHLRQALNFTAHMAYRKAIILFVTRSAPTMMMVEKTAMEAGEYAHTRDYKTYTFTDSARFYGGLTRLPDLIIFLSTLDTVLAPHELVRDAAKMLVPTVGIVDSNCDPCVVTYPVPGNDDTPCAVELYCKLFKEAIIRGKNRRKLDDSQKPEPIKGDDNQRISTTEFSSKPT